SLVRRIDRRTLVYVIGVRRAADPRGGTSRAGHRLEDGREVHIPNARLVQAERAALVDEIDAVRPLNRVPGDAVSVRGWRPTWDIHRVRADELVGQADDAVAVDPPGVGCGLATAQASTVRKLHENVVVALSVRVAAADIAGVRQKRSARSPLDR